MSMETTFDLRSRQYWRQLGWGLLDGLAIVLSADSFIAIMDFRQDLIGFDRAVGFHSPDPGSLSAF